MDFKKVFLEWSSKKRTRFRVIIVLLVGFSVFTVGVPLLIIYLSSLLDGWLGFSVFSSPFIRIVSLVLGALGLLLVGWTVLVQLSRGKGTPSPAVPTQKLVVFPPYTYCRNPMALGTLLYYLGICLFVGSPSSFLLFLLFAVLYLAYIKLIEEKELEERFGETYLEYKKSIPFIIPRLKKHGK